MVKFSEKRKYQRVRENLVLSVIYKAEDSGLQTELHTVTEDIGAGGIRFVLPNQLPKDRLLDMKLFLFADPIPLYARGKVKWLKEGEGLKVKAEKFFTKKKTRKAYWIGVEFIDIEPFTRRRILQLIKREFLRGG